MLHAESRRPGAPAVAHSSLAKSYGITTRKLQNVRHVYTMYTSKDICEYIPDIDERNS